MTGSVETLIGKLPKVASRLRAADHWGTFKARWGVGRMNYAVDPGIYALGQPSEDSPVLVTANYKMSFDYLRAALEGHAAWILVLDTAGINVWCAAGKGTFGTDELVGRVKASGLEMLVRHRRLILPQLAGPGVAAHQVRKRSGFEVVYGPVRAADLPAFLAKGLKASPDMRRKSFSLAERIVLIPIELVAVLKTAAWVLPMIVVLSGLLGSQTFGDNARIYGAQAVGALTAALMAGTILTPILLPWLPGRAFALKGVFPGLAAALIWVAAGVQAGGGIAGRLEAAAWLLLLPAVTAYLGMNFTGASTYTSLSGVKKEMRWAVPLQITASVAGMGLWLGSLLMG